jgi:hypothetical protein
VRARVSLLLLCIAAECGSHAAGPTGSDGCHHCSISTSLSPPAYHTSTSHYPATPTQHKTPATCTQIPSTAHHSPPARQQTPPNHKPSHLHHASRPLRLNAKGGLGAITARGRRACACHVRSATPSTPAAARRQASVNHSMGGLLGRSCGGQAVEGEAATSHPLPSVCRCSCTLLCLRTELISCFCARARAHTHT